METRKGRTALNLQVRTEHKEQLRAISDHHKAKGEAHMSQTLVLEKLIAKEHKRLKL